MKNRRHYYGGIDSWTIVTEAEKNAILSVWSRTATLCSCDMCGNARRNAWSKTKQRLTMQEKRFYSCSEDPDDGVA